MLKKSKVTSISKKQIGLEHWNITIMHPQIFFFFLFLSLSFYIVYSIHCFDKRRHWIMPMDYLDCHHKKIRRWKIWNHQLITTCQLFTWNRARMTVLLLISNWYMLLVLYSINFYVNNCHLGSRVRSQQCEGPLQTRQVVVGAQWCWQGSCGFGESQRIGS